MLDFIRKLSEKFNLSSPISFLALLSVFTLVVCFISDIITTTAFNYRFPDMMALHSSGIREQTFITTLLIAVPCLSSLLYLIRHITQTQFQLIEKIKYDSLTGLLTRDAFLDAFKKQLACGRQRTNDAFLIIDADFFKRINDTHGHIAGDKALVAITEALTKGMRKTDSIGRIGGEEFAVHLNDVTETLALQIAERLRQNVKEASKAFELPNVELSVSIGAVIYKSDMDLSTLMAKADKMLYQAKNNGRNRVEYDRIQNMVAA